MINIHFFEKKHDFFCPKLAINNIFADVLNKKMLRFKATIFIFFICVFQKYTYSNSSSKNTENAIKTKPNSAIQLTENKTNYYKFQNSSAVELTSFNLNFRKHHFFSSNFQTMRLLKSSLQSYNANKLQNKYLWYRQILI